LVATENNSSASLAAAQEDPLFDRAVEIVLETKRGSVSLLQRRLAIGYTRASRLIDLMGIAGIISAHKGSVARDVMITVEEWDLMKEMAAEMEAEQRSGGGDVAEPEIAYGGDPEDEHQATIFIEDEVAVEAAESDIDEVPFKVGVNHHAVEVLGSVVDDATIDAETGEAQAEDEVEDEEYGEEVDELEADEEELEDDEDEEAYAEAEAEEDDEDEEEDEEELVDEADEDDEADEEEEVIEYEYVDEDGNPIDPEDLEGEEYEVEDADEEDEYEEEEYEDEEDEALAESQS